jgi:FKBP-type peptidyl-prolyl cis-trans isomerase FklB
MRKSLVFFVLASGLILASLSQAQTSTASTAQNSQPAANAQGQQSSNQQSSDQQSSPSSTGSAAKKSSAATASAAPLKTEKEKRSYALGMSIGEELARQDLPVDPAIVARGLKETMLGKSAMSIHEMTTLLQGLRGQVEKQEQPKMQALADTNRKAGEAFLTANKTKPGVKVLPDGLQYKILKEGNGPKPTANDTVTVSYRGTLIDGKEFDSSARHGGKVSFPVQRVVKGWTEALQMMPVGSKWELYMPPDLAYGEQGSGDIGPDSTLIFELELISIGEKK